jgi:hypothetical protein
MACSGSIIHRLLGLPGFFFPSVDIPMLFLGDDVLPSLEDVLSIFLLPYLCKDSTINYFAVPSVYKFGDFQKVLKTRFCIDIFLSEFQQHVQRNFFDYSRILGLYK